MAENRGVQSAPIGQVGRYVLRSALASGGMASVYLAHLTGPHGFEKTIAVKRIHPHLVKDRRFVEMFLDEARVAALIHHPNVCSVMDFGEDEGAPYIVMEYLNGESFSSVMKKGREQGGCPIWLAARVVHDAARGLQAAHELAGPDGRPMGVVHRDVSPQNIFVLYDGVTKVVDFGVARARGRLSVTQTNEVKGKLPYMAPEQYENDNIDQRADVWALGVVLWEATTSRRLFRAANDAATIARVLHKPIPRPSSVVSDYPKDLEAIVMRCLARDLEARYASAEALAEDLEQALYSTGKPAGTSQVKRWMSTHFATHIEYRQRLMRGEVPEEPPDLVSSSTLSSMLSKSARTEPPPDEPEQGPTLIETPRVPGTIAVDGPRSDFPTLAGRPSRAGDTPLPLLGRLPTDVPRAWIPITGVLVVFLMLGAWAVVRSGDAPEVAAAPAPAAPVEVPVAANPPPSTEPAVVEVGEPPPAPAPPPSPDLVFGFETVEAPASEADDEADDDEDRPDVRRARPSGPGTLNLLAIPSATVRRDGRVIGETPLIRRTLPAGTHRLQLRTADGRSKTVTVQIRPGRSTRLRVEF